VKEKLVNAALVIETIIFSLLILEVSLRAYHGEWENINFRFPKGMSDHAAFDAELGWVPKQGVWRENGWGAVVTSIEDGIRSNGSGQLPDPTEAILAVGDSFTFGDQVSDWETWPAQLEKLSGRRVINGGVFAYGIDQAFPRARRLLNRYRVSTVIFSFISYDVGRCQMSRMLSAGKPYFRLERRPPDAGKRPVTAAVASPERGGAARCTGA